MASTDTIRLKEEKVTLFIPLYAKALDYRAKKSVLNDSTANEIVNKIGTDLAKHKRFGARALAVRPKQYDEWAKDFIAKNKNEAVVLHLGCGLDARRTRIQPPSSVTWFDVDFPEVISLRKKFYSQADGYKMIATSITAPDWLEAIPADKPALIIAEGVFEYLTEENVRILLNRLTDHFSHGQIAFDVMNSFSIGSRKEKLRKTTGAVQRWAVDDLGEVDRLNPKLKRVDTVPVFKSVFTRELPFGFRSVFWVLTLFPKFSNAMRLLRYEF